MNKRYSGLAVFDVDGVLFRGVFLIRIARTTGLKNYFKTLLLGWRYYTSAISFEELLTAVLRITKNFDLKKAVDIAGRMRKSRNIKETFELLHRDGYYISLMSSGVPNFILKRLAEEYGVEHFAGLEAKIEDGRVGIDSRPGKPKEEVLSSLMTELGLGWRDVVVVADDPNNLSIIQQSRIGIGYNPSRIIRKHADIVIDGYNLLELIPCIIPENRLPARLTRAKYSLSREIYRKFIHFLGVPVPFLAYMNKTAICALLVAVIALYAISETLRYIGFHFPFFSHVTKKARRYTEIRGFIIGPISLTVGILICLLFFKQNVYIPAILIVCISDSLSGLVGKRFGRVKLPVYRRTLEGSLAFFVSAFLILYFFLPVYEALIAAVLPTLIELFSPYDLDNLLVPAGTALFITFVLY